MPSGRTNNFPESGRGLGHLKPLKFLAVWSAIRATAWLLVRTMLLEPTSKHTTIVDIE